MSTFWTPFQSSNHSSSLPLSSSIIEDDVDELRDNDLSRIIPGSIYAILSFALLPNLAVVFLVGQILLARNQGASPNNGASFSSNHNTHILIYIFALSIVDSLVLINAAVVSTTIFLQKWIFHRALCTTYYAIDSVNKTLSTFILTSMSLDRFLAVRYPQKRFRIRSIKGTMGVLAFCLSFAFILLLPVYVQTDIVQVSIIDEDGRNETTPTCAFVGEADFAVALAILGFFAPLILMSVFYASMLSSLNKRRKRLVRTTAAALNRRSSDDDQTQTLRGGHVESGEQQQFFKRPSIRVKTVTTRTLLLVLFHFGCWTPYWITTFYMLLVDPEIRDTAVIIMYLVHVGTYLNSAINPVLYALLNRDLRQRRRNTMRRREKRRAAAIEAMIGYE